MGACCGKGSSTKDPDKAPYGPTKPTDESAKDKQEIPQDKEKSGDSTEATKPQTEAAEGDKKGVEVAANDSNQDTKTEEAHVISVDIATEEKAKVSVENEVTKPEGAPSSVAEEKQDDATKPESGEDKATESAVPAAEKKDVKPSDISLTFRDSFDTPPFRSFRDNWPEIKKETPADSAIESPAYSARFRPLTTASKTYGGYSGAESTPDPKSIIDSLKEKEEKAKQDSSEPVAVSVHVSSTTVTTVSKTESNLPASVTLDQKQDLDDSKDVVITKTVTTETTESTVGSDTQTVTETKSPSKTVTFAVDEPSEPDDVENDMSLPVSTPGEPEVKEDVVKVEAAVETKASITVETEDPKTEDVSLDDETATEEVPALEVHEDNDKCEDETDKVSKVREVKEAQIFPDVAAKEHVNAKVIISPEANRIPEENNIHVEPKSEKLSTASPVTHEKEETVEREEPKLFTKLRQSVKNLLVDYTAPNNHIASEHQLAANTRPKLLHAIDRWFLGNNKDKENYQRGAVLTGRATMGKTCLVVELSRRYKDQLAAYHYFDRRSSNLDHCNLRYVLLSLANQLCDAFPNYITMLPRLEKLEEIVTYGKLFELYETFIEQPLTSKSLRRPHEEPVLILIDAIDDCSTKEKESLLEIVNDLPEKCPEWLRLFVTTRDDNQILAQLDKLHVFELQSSSDGLVDIKRFLKEPMSRFMDRISLDGGLTELAKKSECNFLCALLYKNMLERLPERTVALREIDGLLPTGYSKSLIEIFQNFKTFLGQQFPPRQAESLYHKIIGVLAMSQEPIHVSYISHCGVSNYNDVVEQFQVVTRVDNEGKISFLHNQIADWLLSGNEAGALAVNVSTARACFSDLCQRWSESVLAEPGGSDVAYPELVSYTVKRIITHLTDTPGQQENVAKVLCNIWFLQEKLNQEDVSLRHLLEDYLHEHKQLGSDPEKIITLKEYMKKSPKLAEQIKNYYQFLRKNADDVRSCPQQLFQIAANYPSMQRIQQNARVELGEKPWIENLTALPETPCIVKDVGEKVCGLDVSADGKLVALVTTDDNYNVQMRLLNAATAEEKFHPVDIKTLKDRVGLFALFFSDNQHIFVGSLTTLINTKGKPVPSGLDIQSIELTERFSIECSAGSSKFLVCGLTTFPFGGRSLHLAAFDLKTKKCVKTLEVLKFRFGGSSQFGIKCCALSSNDSLLCAGMKQSPKSQLHVTIWNTSKWEPLYNADINGDLFTKCAFKGDHNVVFGASVKNTMGHSESRVDALQAEIWHFKNGDSAKPHLWDESEVSSVFHTSRQKMVCTQWLSQSSNAVMKVWEKGSMGNSSPSSGYHIRGLSSVSDMRSIHTGSLFLSNDQLIIYNSNDLDFADIGETSGCPTLADINVISSGFVPRSDTVLVVHNSSHSSTNVVSLTAVDVKADEIIMTGTPLEEEVYTRVKRDESQHGLTKYFSGCMSSTDMFGTTSDGTFLVINLGNKVKIWNRVNDKVFDVPNFDDVKGDQEELDDNSDMFAAVSPKDYLVGIVYGQLSYRLYLFDLKSKQMLRHLELQEKNLQARVTDFTFLPYNGHVISYHKGVRNTLAVWSQRSSQQVNASPFHIAYANVSPASDRIAMSCWKGTDEGLLILLNSDGKFEISLPVPNIWLPTNDKSDVSFSSDGTILIGVSMESSVCRIWNAGNGEVLNDLDVKFTLPAEVIGMFTNTHVVFRDDRLFAVDVASGKVATVLPLETYERKTSGRGLRISPRGNILTGANDAGQLSIFKCHNFAAVKRKTTLQRMKSFVK